MARKKKVEKKSIPELPKELFYYWVDPCNTVCFGGWDTSHSIEEVPRAAEIIGRYTLSSEGKVCSHFKPVED